MSEDVAASFPSPSSNAHSNASPAQTPSPLSDSPRLPQQRPPSSRAIVPSNITPRVPITTASSPTNDYSIASPVGSGPTSASYVVPPRPKPGRKPATDEPASKRKAQNRESQRAFRARKAAKLTEMQAQVESATSKHKQELEQRLAEINERQIRIDQLEAMLSQLKEMEKRTASERDFWRERAESESAVVQSLERQLRDRESTIMQSFGDKQQPVFFPTRMSDPRQDSPNRESFSGFTGFNAPAPVDLGCGNCKANGECACIAEIAKATTTNTYMAAVPLPQAPSRSNSSPMKGIQSHSNPAADPFAEREIDFTAQFSTKRQKIDQRPSIAFMTQTNEVDAKCGFCTDDSNCLCRDSSIQIDAMQRSDDVPPATAWNSTPSDDKNAASGPGSCADCQANPRQRAWCQRVAQLRAEGSSNPPTPSSRAGSIGSLDTMEPPIDNASMGISRSSIGCSDAFRLFKDRVPMDQDKMEWISNLRPVSPVSRRGSLPLSSPRKYSALEIDTAGVIATLGNTMGPLEPRKSDGANRDIIIRAQEYRRASGSPRVSVERSSPMPVSSLMNGTTRPTRNWGQ
ncbi:hypothetical protein BS50DRAFT_13811 [Corynespora cassiicola Philippines]|uniref:BZIP domain-containing protein n=1 Tax=Corynespora cassiicola Philippines TaxID=1448308 RepID=A0A2T2P9J7_CORCC|nr:hypothetical protein BS50DRAFT_13811 [Corynespora cassiicola Philippines]